MTRIGESSDDQRIREMNEAEARQKADREKRLDTERVTRSFQDVMRDQANRDGARRLAEQATERQTRESKDAKPKDKTGEKRGQEKAVADGRAAQRRQAMSGALGQSLSKTREKLSHEARVSEHERNTELVRKSDDEQDTRRVDTERGDRAERALEERRMAEAQLLHVDPDDQRKQGKEGKNGQRDRDGQESTPRDAKGVDGVASKAGAQGAPKIPEQILEAIAKSVAMQISPDGRTELAISLKGTLLDGVTLHVTAKKGKVFCTFEGADKQLGNLIESSRGELMRQLGKRGLELEGLRVR
jgi:hypothetical protein